MDADFQMLTNEILDLYESAFYSDGFFRDTLMWIESGGPVAIILLALAILALTMTLLKLWQFHHIELDRHQTVEQMLALYRTQKFQEALALGENTRNPVAQIVVLAIRGKLQRSGPEQKVREEVDRLARGYIERLKIFQRPLEVIAVLAPLLGLLGSVQGMIEVFQKLQPADTPIDLSFLSSSIWKALFTTAIGLTIAIPVIMVVYFFDYTLDRLAHDMDDNISRVFTEDSGKPYNLDDVYRDHANHFSSTNKV